MARQFVADLRRRQALYANRPHQRDPDRAIDGDLVIPGQLRLARDLDLHDVAGAGRLVRGEWLGHPGHDHFHLATRPGRRGLDRRAAGPHGSPDRRLTRTLDVRRPRALGFDLGHLQLEQPVLVLKPGLGLSTAQIDVGFAHLELDLGHPELPFRRRQLHFGLCQRLGARQTDGHHLFGLLHLAAEHLDLRLRHLELNLHFQLRALQLQLESLHIDFFLRLHHLLLHFAHRAFHVPAFAFPGRLLVHLPGGDSPRRGRRGRHAGWRWGRGYGSHAAWWRRWILRSRPGFRKCDAAGHAARDATRDAAGNPTGNARHLHGAPDCRGRGLVARLERRTGRRHRRADQHHTQDHGRDGDPADQRRAAVVARRHEQPAHAPDERAIGRRQRRARHRGHRGKVGERGHVLHPIAHADRHIVATVFPLAADFARHPPDGGMVEQQRLDNRLQEVDDVVVAPDVRQFVGEKRLDLRRREARQGRRRQQHHGLQPANENRNGHRG